MNDFNTLPLKNNNNILNTYYIKFNKYSYNAYLRECTIQSQENNTKEFQDE